MCAVHSWKPFLEASSVLQISHDDLHDQNRPLRSARWCLFQRRLVLFARRRSAAEINDYPTSARADYVFACMQANGETHQTLDRCSCSIDVIASLIPYERYVDAETVMSMIQTPGNLGNMFRATEFSKKVVDDLRRAQAEAEIRCF